jgi:AraC-like DNA-binding protein
MENTNIHKSETVLRTIIFPAIQYMLDNYTRKIRIKEIAETIGVSYCYFCSNFKKEMGITALSYLKQIRVKETCRLLRETNEPLRKIAKYCGFTDISWFFTTFKKYSGTSPYQYRKQYKVIQKDD